MISGSGLFLHCRQCPDPIRVLGMDSYGRMMACLNYSANVFDLHL